MITWYMSPDKSARIVSYQWWPADKAAEVTPMAEGTLYFAKRGNPSDVWEVPVTIATLNLSTARALATGEGFVHEEAS